MSKGRYGFAFNLFTFKFVHADKLIKLKSQLRPNNYVRLRNINNLSLKVVNKVIIYIIFKL